MATTNATRLKKPANKVNSQPAIINSVTVAPVRRAVNDIGAWRAALRSADSGNRIRLYDLYDDILLDGILHDAIDKRIDAVKDADLSFTIDNKDVDIMYDLIDTVEFEHLVEEIMLSKFWGVSLTEFYFNRDRSFGFHTIPRKHVRTDRHIVLRNQADNDGIPYDGIPEVVQWGGDDDLGLLLKVAPMVIYKRGGFGDWAQFVELFGMPQRIGKYNSMDTASRRQLEEAMKLAGSAPYLIIPRETEVEQHNGTAAGNGNLYNAFRQACTEEILITVLGQTMTSVDGSSLAQGQVHLQVQEKKHRADRRFVERMLNRHFVPLLLQYGYPIQGGKFKFLENKRELEVAEVVQLASVMDIPQSYLHERYNIPLPKDGEPLAGYRTRTDTGEDGGETGGGGTAATRSVENTGAGIGEHAPFFVQAPADSPAGASQSTSTSRTSDSADTGIARHVAAANGYAFFHAPSFHRTAEHLLKAVLRGYRNGLERLADFGYEYGHDSDAFVTALEQNIYHFSAAKTLAEVQQLNQAFRNAKSFSDFKERAGVIIDSYDRRWLRTEYQTALLTAQAAANYNRLSADAALYPVWVYRTVNDGRVRDEHLALDGLRLPYNDPRWDKIFPPNGWNCRCRVDADLADRRNPPDYAAERRRADKFMQSDEWKRAVRHGFDSNRAKANIIFSKNQMYIKDFLKDGHKLIERITPQEWGVKPLADMVSDASGTLTEYLGTPEDWFAKHAIDGILAVTDYVGRKWVMKHLDFVYHTTGSHKGRVKLLDALFSTMKNPDEVWLGIDPTDNNKELNNFKMVKFFKGKAVSCVGKVQKGRLLFKTFYEVNTPRVRQGLLIKKK